MSGIEAFVAQRTDDQNQQHAPSVYGEAQSYAAQAQAYLNQIRADSGEIIRRLTSLVSTAKENKTAPESKA